MRRAAGAAVLVALACIGFAGVAPVAARPARPAFPPGRPTKVLLVGDSVMLGAAPQFGAALPGREVVVDAKVNRSTGQGAQVVAERGSDWDVVVVMLGHNDGGSPGAYQPPASRINDQLAGVPRVVWLSIHEVRPYYRDVNAFLRSQAASHPNVHVADWNALVSANPGSTAGDGLHLNGRGAGLMAGLVAGEVQTAEEEQSRALASLAQATTTTAAPTTTTTAPTTTSTAPVTSSTASSVPASTTVPASTAPGVTGPAPGFVDETAKTNARLDRMKKGGLLKIALGVVLIGLAVWRLVVVFRRSRRRSLEAEAEAAIADDPSTPSAAAAAPPEAEPPTGEPTGAEPPEDGTA